MKGNFQNKEILKVDKINKNTQNEEKKENNLLIDLDGIFGSNNYSSNKSDYTSNSNQMINFGASSNISSDPLDSIFKSINLISPRNVQDQDNFQINNLIDTSSNINALNIVNFILN